MIPFPVAALLPPVARQGDPRPAGRIPAPLAHGAAVGAPEGDLEQDVSASSFKRIVFTAVIGGTTCTIDGVSDVGASANTSTHTVTWTAPSGVSDESCTMTAAIYAAGSPAAARHAVWDGCGGRFAAWCAASAPKRVLAGRKELPFGHDVGIGFLSVEIAPAARHPEIKIVFP